MTLPKLQANWRTRNERAEEYRRELKQRYGDVWRAPRGKEARLQSLTIAADRAQEAVFAWLDAHSPRDWRHGPPCFWVCDKLTEADALTRGALSVVPPRSYGQYPSDAQRFARPLDAALSAG